MRYATVLFDLDGTLLDTIGMIVESLEHALNEHLGWVPSHPELVAGVGTPLLDQLRGHVARVRDEVCEDLVSTLKTTYVSHNLSIHDDRVSAYPGAGATLDGLRAAGARLGIVTSKPNATARRGLRLCGLESYFEVVVGSDDVVRHKPDPMPVFAALEQLGAPASSAVFIGDSPHDVRAGNVAGVRTGAALWGPFPRESLTPAAPSYWLDAPTDVLDLL